MESIRSRLAANNSTLDSDKTLRLRQPPTSGGRAFQDFGSTPWCTVTPRQSQTSRKREVRNSHSEADSDDEIDWLSNGNSDYVCSEKKSKTKPAPSRVRRGNASTPSPSNGVRQSTAATTRQKHKKPKKADPDPDDQSPDATTQPTPRPRPRPKPVARNSRSYRSLVSDTDDECFESRHRHENLIIGQTGQSDDDASRKSNIKSFPDLSPLRRDDDDADGKLTVKAKSKAKKGISEFPSISPLSCPKVVASKTDGTNPISEPDDDDDDDDDDDELAMRPDDHILTRGGLRPFPMEATMLMSANESSSSSPEPSTVKPKRARKKSSGKSSRPLREFPMNDDMFKDMVSTPSPDREASCQYSYDDSKHEELMSPVVDPRTLCPYCDTPLPTNPTRTLMSLISRASKHKSSCPDPRPINPRGLRAPVQVFIGVCQRHRFESEILPEAESRGWPKNIDWGTMRDRVKRMEARLRALLNDSEHTRSGSQLTPGPRANCVFWKEVIKEVKIKGSRAVNGVSGQYANFHKIQPGYYGELGSVIIHQTLYDLFPPHDLDPTSTAPLTPDDFIRVVLVPEVGLRLIMEDRGLTSDLDIAEGVEILRASAKYGVAMFPDDDSEWGDPAANRRKGREEIGAADMILMERARRRRRELALEEADEEEEEILVSKAAQKQDKMSRSTDVTAGKRLKKEGRKPKGKEVDMSASNEAPRPLPRAKPVERSQPHDDDLPGKQELRISPRGFAPPDNAPDTEAVDARVSQSHSKQESIRHLGPAIDLDSSDGLELTDSSCSAFPPRRRRTKEAGKRRETGITDFSPHTRTAISLSTGFKKAHTDMTPRGERKASKPTGDRVKDSAVVPGPSDKNFRPLKAARARKHDLTAALSDKTHTDMSDGWIHNMSTPIPSSDDSMASISKSSVTRTPLKTETTGTLEWLLSDSEMV